MGEKLIGKGGDHLGDTVFLPTGPRARLDHGRLYTAIVLGDDGAPVGSVLIKGGRVILDLGALSLSAEDGVRLADLLKRNPSLLGALDLGGESY